MAQQAVFTVLERGGNLAVDEVKYLWSVSDKLEAAKKKLLRMQAFLTDLDDKMLKGHAMARNLVSEVREVAYEVEDIVDTANIMTRQSDPKISIRGAISRYACFPISLNSLHKLGARLDSATAKMETIFEDFGRYNITATAIAQESRVYITADDTIKHWRAVHTDFGEEFDVIGFDEQIKQIKDDLLDSENSNLTVVSIVGPGGAGKTTMANKVYGSAVVKGHFEAQAWITVSQNVVPHVLLKEIVEKLIPQSVSEHMIRNTIMVVEELEGFVPSHFLEEVIRHVMEHEGEKKDSTNKGIKDLHRDELEATIKCLIKDYKPEEEATVKDLLKELINLLIKGQENKEIKKLEELNEERVAKLLTIFTLHKRYLIVLDDIWSTYAWDIITACFPDKKNGSRIVLTTRNANIAQHPRARKKIYNPKLLDEEESTKLLLRTALQEYLLDGGSSTCAKDLSEFKNVGRELAVKCCGLPLAIIVLGGYLSRNFDVEEWKQLTISSMDWHALITADRIIGAILDLSFYDMPSHLRACFMYTTAFPEDFRIDVQVLAILWIAEGFIPWVRGHTREKLAIKYVAELVQRCMIQVEKRTSSGRIKVIKVHDILRDWGIGHARREGLMKDCYNVEDIDKAYSGEMVNAYRIVLHGSLGREAVAFTSKLRTLLDFSRYSKNPKVQAAKSFQGLHVLFLHSHSGQFFVPSEIGKMRYLRYLGMAGNCVYYLPSSIGNLLSLETLYATASIDNIPGSLWKICTLRRVYVPRAERLLSVPQILSSRSSKVQAMVFGAGSRDFSHPATYIGYAERIMIAAKKKVSKNKNPSLSCCFGMWYGSNGMEITGRCKRALQFPSDVPDFEAMRNITLLKICCANLLINDHMMLQIGKMNQLRMLEIGEQSYTGRVLTFPSGSFPRLQRLMLHDLAVADWTVECGSMSLLRDLRLCKCHNLSYLPEMLSRLQLCKLDLISMPSTCYHQGSVARELERQGCQVFVTSNEKYFWHLDVRNLCS